MLGVHKIIGANIAISHIFPLLLAACFISTFLIDFRIWLAFIGLSTLFTLFLKPFLFYLLFVFLISTEGMPGLEDFSYAKFAGIILVLFIAFRVMIKRERIDLTDSFYIYLLLFFIGAFVSTLGAKDYLTSLSTILTYFTLGGLFFVTRYFLTSIENIDKTLTVLLVSVLITYVLAQFVGSADESFGTWRMSSGTWDPNEFGAFILVLLPLGLYRAMYSFGLSKVFFYVLILAFMIFLIFTGSRGGMLGFIGMTAILVFHYGHRRSKQVFFFIFMSAIVLYFFASEEFWYRAATILNPEREAETQSSSISIRWALYHAAWQMFLDHPFIGVGIYNFKYDASNYGLQGGLVVHNTYLELLSGGGLLTFIPFALILIDRFRKLRLNRNYDNKLQDLIICLKASLVSFLITAMFYSSDHEKIFWFLLALISSAYYLASNKERETQSSGDHAATATTIGNAN